MAQKVSRVLDSLVIGEETTPGTEASNYNIKLFGDIVTGNSSVEEEVKVIGGLRGGTTQGHLPSKTVDLKVTPTIGMTFHPNNLTFLKYVISDYTDDGTNYTLANRSSASPKSVSIKGNYDNSNAMLHLGNYLTNMRFSLVDEDILSVTTDIKSLFCDYVSGVVEYVAPTEKPLTFINSKFTVNGNEWDLQTLNVTFDPKMIQKWGMNTKVAGRERFPTDIFRGGKCGIAFDGVANINDITKEVNIVWGGTSPQLRKDDLTLVLEFNDVYGKTHTINIIGKISNLGNGQSDSEENSKTVSFTGVGIDFTASGEL